MAKRYLVLACALVLLASLLTPLSVSPQPPVMTDTLHVGHSGSWGPKRADPVRAYDTLSDELLTNVYDTLIGMNGEISWDFVPILATNVPARIAITKHVWSSDGITWNDSSVKVGWVDDHKTGSLDAGDVLYMAEAGGSYRTWFVQSLAVGPVFDAVLWRGSYTFQIRASPAIDFVNDTGGVVDTFDVYDVEYSLQRGLVQDQYGSPMWMFYEPLFAQMTSDFVASNVTEPTVMTLAHLIDNAVEVSGNNLTINVGIPFPDTAFKQILAQSWGSIVSKEWCISKGCWNGDLYADSNGDKYPDWWGNWHHVYISPIQTLSIGNYAGTGPYRVTLIDSANKIVRLSRNANYWRGWPVPGAKSFLETIEISYEVSPQRPNLFTDGTLDVYDVPRAYWNEWVNQYGEPIYPNVKMVKNLFQLSERVALFTFSILQDSAYIYTGRFPDGVPTDFFNNTHVRKAFAYAFNHSKYLRDVWNGDAICSETPLIYGLVPEYSTRRPDPPWTYDVNYDAAEAELRQATFNGTNVWDSGFHVDVLYVLHSTFTETDRMALELLRDFFAALSTHDGRTGPPFNIGVASWDPWVLMDWDWRSFPMYILGWTADFADADNFMRPYMHSYEGGDFAYFQNYTTANGWGSRKDELLDLAIKTPDGPERASLYAELQQIYIDDCPSFPIFQLSTRMWMQYWVKGLYYNALVPSPRYSRLWKENTCWADITGPTEAIPDGVTSMRDIGYIGNRFGAKPPDPTEMLPPNTKWGNGTYGAGCPDVTGDRRVDMRDIGFACAHFGDTSEP